MLELMLYACSTKNPGKKVSLKIKSYYSNCWIGKLS